MSRLSSAVAFAAAALALGSMPAASQPATDPAGQSAAAAPLTAEDFAQLPFVTSPLLSPDGLRIAARVFHEGEENIAVWAVGGERGRPTRLIHARDIESFEWANDDILLFTARTVLRINVAGIVLPLPMQRIVSYDLRAGRPIVLGGEGAFSQSVIFVDPAGRYALLSTLSRIDRGPSVQRVDLATGEAVEVQPAVRNVNAWFADPAGVVRVGVDYGERRTRYYYRADAETALRLIDTRRNLTDDSVIDMIRLVTDTDRGVIVTNAETGRFAIYEYDFATDTRGAVLFAHDRVDVTRPMFGADGALTGVFYEDDRPRVHWLDPTMRQIQARIDRTFPDHTNLVVNASRDGNRILVFSSSASDPGTYYVYDQAGRRMEIFASPFDHLVDRSLAEVRPVRYPSRDGLEIEAYLTMPPGAGEQRLPLIVLPHGGPFLRDSWTFNAEAQFLASRGYAVLQPNFRGSTGYGRDFVERGYGQFGTGMIDDIDAGVDWLTEQGIADRERVCIMGASYGGYAAIWGAMRSPERYRCAIAHAAVTDLRAMLRYDMRSMTAGRYAREWRRRVRGEEETDLDDVSPIRHPERLRVPLLLAHGEQDTNVPPDHSRRLLRELERTGAQVESVFYPKSGHGFSDTAEALDYMRRVEAFLARHNPAGAVTAGGAEASAR